MGRRIQHMSLEFSRHLAKMVAELSLFITFTWNGKRLDALREKKWRETDPP